MTPFGHMSQYDYGEVHLKRDNISGLSAIIAVHDRRLGPALGGCRFLSYPDDESAFIDALRLARGMTYKAALAGLEHGGGKSVIIKPEGRFDRHKLFQAFGRFVDSLHGMYYTAEDSGTQPEDMKTIRSVTRYVTGVDTQEGGSGNPSPFTALGIRRGIEACIKHVNGSDSLEGVRVNVQGTGQVGTYLCKELAALGAILTVSDIDEKRTHYVAEQYRAKVCDNREIHRIECDVYAPCALGGAINDATIDELHCKIVAGGANNQLTNPHHGDTLHRKGIVYAPDYAINAGGLINVAQELKGYDPVVARERTMKIYDTILEILNRSKSEGKPTHQVADQMAEERLETRHEAR